MPVAERPHTERWAYRKLYTRNIFAFATRLYPYLRRPGAQLLSRSVAWTYAVTQPAVRRVVRNNLSLLSNRTMTDADAVKVFVNYGSTIADYIAVGAMPAAQARALCSEHLGAEHLEAATAGGRGVILVTGHFSFFEYGAVVLNQSGHRAAIATMPEPTTELTEWRARWRERWSTRTIAVGADPFSSLQVIRAITEGSCMAMLADRPIGESGVPVPLPNGRILFSTSPALLAWMTGCQVLPSVTVRRPDGGYRIVTKPPITVTRVPHGERNAELERCTRLIAASVFEEICQTPHQWYQFVPVGL